MIIDKLQELEKQKAKIAEMEKSVLAERQTQMQRLHAEMGYATRADLIKALRSLGNAPAKRAAKKGAKKAGKKAAKKAAAPAAKKEKKASRRKRTTITPELRAKIVAAVQAGGTGAAVAKEFGVSLPTVQNIKKAAGMVKAGGAEAPKAEA